MREGRMGKRVCCTAYNKNRRPSFSHEMLWMTVQGNKKLKKKNCEPLAVAIAKARRNENFYESPLYRSSTVTYTNKKTPFAGKTIEYFVRK